MNKNINANDIGQIIRHFRKQNGLSQLQLAQRAGVGKTVVFDIEKGKPSVQLDTLLKIFDALKISLKLKIPTLQLAEEAV